MKHTKFIFCFLLTSMSFSHLTCVELVWDVGISGPYLTAGTVDGDLVVVNGSVLISSGNLIVNGDLKVTTGKVRVCCGNLEVDGDLIVTNRNSSGEKDATIQVSGDLEVTGAIITKSASGHAYIDVKDYFMTPDDYFGGNIKAGRISTWGYLDAYIIADHHITVSGAIVTKSDSCHAFVSSRGQSPTYGDIYAEEIFTYAAEVPPIEPDMEEFCTNPCFPLGFRNGPPPPSGAVVQADNGHVLVTGPIVTYAKGESFEILGGIRSFGSYANAYVFAEGNIEAASITTFADGGDAYVSAEKVKVNGDIRTEAMAGETILGGMITRQPVSGGDAHVQARESLLPSAGTFEDITAQNIYTSGESYDGFNGFSAYVRAYRHIEVIGDIVTLEKPNGIYDGCVQCDSAYVRAGFDEFEGPHDGHIKAQNIMTKSPTDAYVQAMTGIDVTGEIITESTYFDGDVYTDYGHIRAGNIATQAACDASVHNSEKDVDVTHVISTKSTGNCQVLSRNGSDGYAYVYAEDGSIKAEKIFTDGEGDSSVQAGFVLLGRNGAVEAGNEIRVKGPISTISGNDWAYVAAVNDISAGAISTDGYDDSAIWSVEKSINIAEDIRTKSGSSYGSVEALYGDLRARSIRTEGFEAGLGTRFDPYDSVKSDAGSGEFTLVPNLDTAQLVIENAEFNLDSDHEWDVDLVLLGTCTFNGNGHALNFGPNARIFVASDSGLYLQNITLRNVKNFMVICANTATLSIHNVTFMQSGDYSFESGELAISGMFRVQGPGTRFIYQSLEPCTINKNATMFFDHGVIFEPSSPDFGMRSILQDRFVMSDASSRMHFNNSTLDAGESVRLTKGTLVFDNTVTFSVPEGETIRFGDNNNASENINFEFHEASKLIYSGDLVNQNV